MILSLLLTLQALAGPIHLLELDGSINPGSASYIVDAVRRAQDEQASAVVLRLNTPGGLLSSTRDIIRAIGGSKVPFVTYIGPAGASATSAGALITIAGVAWSIHAEQAAAG